MRIAIVHYHLRPGGVARVVAHALSALREVPDLQVCVLASGEIDRFTYPERVGIVSGLAYSDEGVDLTRLETDLREKASSLLGGPPDLWHVHNHSLGKNPSYHRLVMNLAKEGEALLLQIHDFAEDGRPGNYALLRDGGEPLESCLYPCGGRVHYAVLNGRDRSILAEAGVPQGLLHFLPNSVDLALKETEAMHDESLEGKRLLLYPTRSIRRKNLGELLLWSTQAGTDDIFGVTLPPENAEALRVYDRWKVLANRYDLPIRFELGKMFSFDALLQGAERVMTTSVAEGFGLAYLESWLIPRPISGRDLPEITDDFKREGLRLPGLYDILPVPMEQLDERSLRDTFCKARTLSLAQFGRKTDDRQSMGEWASWTEEGWIDFGRLDESHQAGLIERICRGEADGSWLPSAPWLQPVSEEQVQENHQRVREQYGLTRYRERLLEAYHHVLDAPAAKVDALDPDRVLDLFLTPERFNLLRT